MIRVRAPSRLHFGFLSLPDEDRWPNRGTEKTLPARRYGGVGLMVEVPGIRLTAQPAAGWSATGPLAERALEFAGRLRDRFAPGEIPPQHFVVEDAAPEHVGLGSGTQLSLAVARVVATAAGWAAPSAVDLARHVGRGARSALGIYGFEHGGFLVEGGQGAGSATAPLLARLAFPEPWRILLILPAHQPGLHGEAERRAFQRLEGLKSSLATTDTLCRLVLLGMLPALAEEDEGAFGEAVYDFNVRVGEMFAPVQGGVYANPLVAELVVYLRGRGVRGVGQSSWGPGVFALAPDPDRAAHLAEQVRCTFRLGVDQVLVSRACNRGARFEHLAP
jgi:beta-RFAP synthase